MHAPPVLKTLRGKLIVSCQAPDGDPFQAPEHLCLFARAAVQGGAGGIRVDGEAVTRLVRASTSLPIIGIKKTKMADGKILITPTNEDARLLAEAGASIVAMDLTRRGISFGARDRLRYIHTHLNLPVWGDISTVEEAVAAVDAGADAVLSTLRGYTVETSGITTLDLDFIRALVQAVHVPVIAEGWISTPAEAALAIQAGAFAVVVGTAITRPVAITQRFAAALPPRP